MNRALYSQINEKYEYLRMLSADLVELCTQTEKKWSTASGKQYCAELSQMNEYTLKILEMFGEEFKKCSVDESTDRPGEFRF